MDQDNYITILNTWNDNIKNKIFSLKKAAKYHKLFGVILLMIIAFCLTSTGFLSTFDLSSSLNSKCDKTQNLSVSVIILTLTIIAALSECLNSVINPLRTAKDCSNVSKQYNELYKEIQVEILGTDIECPDDPEVYKQRLLYYSTKEQLILVSEPLLITAKSKGAVLTPRDSITGNIKDMRRTLKRRSNKFDYNTRRNSEPNIFELRNPGSSDSSC